MHGFATWNVWATLTFKRDISEPFALAIFRAWCVKVARGSHMPIAFACEPQACGRPHVHVLLAVATESETAERLHARLLGDWHAQHNACGRSVAEAFDQTRGAAWYSAQHETWMVDIVCPRPAVCRTRKGCIQLRKR